MSANVVGTQFEEKGAEHTAMEGCKQHSNIVVVIVKVYEVSGWQWRSHPLWICWFQKENW